MTVGELKLQLTVLCSENKKFAQMPVEILAAYFADGSPCSNPTNTIEIRGGVHHGKRGKILLIK